MRCGLTSYVIGLFLLALCGDSLWSAEPDAIDFTSQIKPLLSDRCFQCHGPDAENRQADLRLDTRDGAFGLLSSDETRHVIAAGRPDASELFQRIVTNDHDLRMPPVDSKISLSKDEIELIRRWIEQGAEWKEHWSFAPIVRPEVPASDDSEWPVNEIDRFVLRRIQAAGLSPSREADRRRLIRRVTFDLTGLPPTREEVTEFVNDQSPDAYERLVDRLLASEQYGERMTAEWLDVARYSDTFGYQVDRDRFVWPWRDWVIRAFNTNMPYDQFVIEQLAGDLLPEPTRDQILATTFNRLHPQKVEGGSVPEEFRVEYVADRNQTFATAFLGLTLECARCHDHKYDPVTQREYYQLFAYFNNIDEAGLYSYFTNSTPTPTLLLPSDVAEQSLNELLAQVRAAEEQSATPPPGARERFEQWLGTRPPVTAADESDVVQQLIPAQTAYLNLDSVSGKENQSVPGRIGNAVRLSGDEGIGVGTGNFRRFEPFSVALWMNTPDEKERAVVFHRSRAWTDAASRGYQLLIENGRLSASLIHFWPGNAIRIQTREKIPVKQWLHVAITWDGSSRADGLRLWINGQVAETEVVRDNLYKNITGGGGDNITIGERFRDRGFTGGLVDEFRVFNRQLSSLEVAQLHDQQTLVRLLQQPTEELTAEQRERLWAHYLLTVDPPAQARRDALRELRKQYCEKLDGQQEIMVMRELAQRRPTFVLKRGAYDQPTDPVDPETPAVFPTFPADQPRNRLGLARWLMDPNHPLTARVAVNRLWQMCFGEGLVRTPEDFGSQGQRPTHPELLDWLARDFIDHGWNVKRLLKQIVMSATYRQSSEATPELRRVDPENRLLARASSYRLTAEMLRDFALATSGLLKPTIGGPPVKPYEVAVSFKPVARDKGNGLYRRSLYTYWKRTGPAPVMMTLDASKRDVCRVKRERTSTPLQAFVLLNGPQFVEASRALAGRMLELHPNDVPAAVSTLFETCTNRPPDEAELKILLELYEAQKQDFANDPERANQYLANGDLPVDENVDRIQLAALAVVANTLMGLDECVMKR